MDTMEVNFTTLLLDETNSTEGNFTYLPETEEIPHVAVDRCSEGMNYFRWFTNVVVTSPLVVVGLLGNALLFVLAARSIRQEPTRAVTNVLLLALSLIDIILLLLVVPLRIWRQLYTCSNLMAWFADYYSHTVYHTYPNLYVLRMIEEGVITILAMNRALTVIKPAYAKRLITVRFTLIQISAVVVFSFAFSSPRYFEITMADGHIRFRSFANSIGYMIGYKIVAFLICMYVIPMACLCVANFMMMRGLERASSQTQVASIKNKHTPIFIARASPTEMSLNSGSGVTSAPGSPVKNAIELVPMQRTNADETGHLKINHPGSPKPHRQRLVGNVKAHSSEDLTIRSLIPSMREFARPKTQDNSNEHFSEDSTNISPVTFRRALAGSKSTECSKFVNIADAHSSEETVTLSPVAIRRPGLAARSKLSRCSKKVTRNRVGRRMSMASTGVTIMVVTIVTAFIVCNSMPMVSHMLWGLVEAFPQLAYLKKYRRYLSIASNLAIVIHQTLNLALYILANKHGRNKLKHLIGCCKCPKFGAKNQETLRQYMVVHKPFEEAENAV